MSRACYQVAVGLALAFGAAAPAWADAQPGLTAFQAGRFAEAVQSWEDAAAAGDAAAALYLGAAFDTGQGVPQDYARALDWYRRAAEAGNVVGMFNAGIMYDAGRGAAQEPAEAARWYARAAAKGFGRAEYNLALMCEAGSGVTKDRARAIRLYQAAAGHGIAAARFHLAQLGVASPGGIPEAARRDAPRDDGGMQAFDQAQRLLLARDPAATQRAAALFRQAADGGNPLAQYDLGYCYEHGIGIGADMSEAVRWYRLAAAKAPNATMRAMAEAGVNGALTKVSHAQR